jgi:hypothetical protein
MPLYFAKRSGDSCLRIVTGLINNIYETARSQSYKMQRPSHILQRKKRVYLAERIVRKLKICVEMISLYIEEMNAESYITTNTGRR